MHCFRNTVGMLAAGAALAGLCPPAAAGTATASSQGFVFPEGGYARVFVACSGDGGGTAVRVVIACEVFDSSGGPGIRHQRSFTGPLCGCVVNGHTLVMPVEVCSTVVATYSDLTTDTATECRAFPPGAVVPHGPTQTSIPPEHQCIDPVGIEATRQQAMTDAAAIVARVQELVPGRTGR